MSTLAALTTELTTDPLGIGYSGMSDQAAADSLNDLVRPGPASSSSILDYLMRNSHRNSNLYGRVAATAASTPGSTLPLGDAGAAITLTLVHIASAHALLKYADGEGALEPLTDAAFDTIIDDLAGGAPNAQCMGPAHKTALTALSQNRTSRAAEIGWGVVKVFHVAAARA